MTKISLIPMVVVILLTLALISAYAALGELDHVVITPESAKVALAGSMQFTAKGYDEAGSELDDLALGWSMARDAGHVDSEGLFTAGMETGFYENAIRVKATQGNVTKIAYASVSIVKPVDVEVEIGELPSANGYMYTCLVKNIGMETCNSFTVKYSGDEPVYHSEPSGWHYKAEAGTIWWSISTSQSERIDPGETHSLYFMVTQQLPQIGWQAKHTSTGNLDIGSVETFINASLSPLEVEVKVSVTQGLDGYLYTFFVKNIGEKTCNHFWVRYGEGVDSPIDHSEPRGWSYRTEADTIWWSTSKSQSERIDPGETSSFYFSIPQESLQIDWRAKYTPTGDMDFGSHYSEVGPPSIAQVVPEIGPAGQPVTITGVNFADRTTVTFGEMPAASVNVISSTEITVNAPAGNEDGWVDIQVQSSGGSATRSRAFRYYSDVEVVSTIGTFTARVALMQGTNMISLPLKPSQPYTASSLAEELDSTIVIRAVDSVFDAYVHAGGIGTDFPIEMGKGYIVNLMEAQTFEVAGQPWGIPAAPPASVPSELWAFVIAGWIDGPVPIDGRLRITNLHTGESLVLPISSSGEFTAAFVDMSRRSVLAAGDEIVTQLIGLDGFPLMEARRHRISQEQIARACLMVHLSATPEKTRLLQNYPNPFNPETWIPFQLAQAASVEIGIYDLTGRLIRNLDLGYYTAGWHISKGQAAYWDGRNNAGERVSTGIYFYCLHTDTGSLSAQRKLVIVK